MKRQFFVGSAFLAALCFSNEGLGARLSDDPSFRYEVRFTNPECREYRYREDVRSVSGERLRSKPQGAYCTGADTARSANRPESPFTKIVEWVRDPSTREIFFAYLSFSNSAFQRELCEAVRERGVKITFVLDSGTELELANKLLACRPRGRDGEGAPTMLLRGHEGGIGYAHNKIFMVNPGAPGVAKISFSSGNMSSGLVTHHENWHFIEADSRSHFVQAHLCLMEAQREHASSAREYSEFMRQCRGRIDADEEEDVRAFFIPGDGERATRVLTREIGSAGRVGLAAHRFSYSRLNRAIEERLGDRRGDPGLRIVVDDDVYWVGETGEQTGPNTADEYRRIKGFERRGLEARYMETNHGIGQLHHNKFAVFSRESGGAYSVFAGAGNFTGTAFESNFENFYFIEVPSVVNAFEAQYERLWGLATAPGDLPAANVLPR